ncbi:hypothetical protein HDU85_005794 [Gaertneriomyces sp. JEL0708]|nr:hypothetical protein HDU85_005794 [Gaertneriomyces sp. JEL0708]
MSEEHPCQWHSPSGPACTQTFPTADALFTHLTETHIGRSRSGNLCLTCYWQQCGKEFQKRDHVTSHLRKHLDIRNHVCPICARPFKRKQDLAKHHKVHSKEGDEGVGDKDVKEEEGGRDLSGGLLQPPSTNEAATAYLSPYSQNASPSHSLSYDTPSTVNGNTAPISLFDESIDLNDPCSFLADVPESGETSGKKRGYEELDDLLSEWNGTKVARYDEDTQAQLDQLASLLFPSPSATHLTTPELAYFEHPSPLDSQWSFLDDRTVDELSDLNMFLESLSDQMDGTSTGSGQESVGLMDSEDPFKFVDLDGTAVPGDVSAYEDASGHEPLFAQCGLLPPRNYTRVSPPTDYGYSPHPVPTPSTVPTFYVPPPGSTPSPTPTPSAVPSHYSPPPGSTPSPMPKSGTQERKSASYKSKGTYQSKGARSSVTSPTAVRESALPSSFGMITNFFPNMLKRGFSTQPERSSSTLTAFAAPPPPTSHSLLPPAPRPMMRSEKPVVDANTGVSSSSNESAASALASFNARQRALGMPPLRVSSATSSLAASAPRESLMPEMFVPMCSLVIPAADAFEEVGAAEEDAPPPVDDETRQADGGTTREQAPPHAQGMRKVGDGELDAVTRQLGAMKLTAGAKKKQAGFGRREDLQLGRKDVHKLTVQHLLEAVRRKLDVK